MTGCPITEIQWSAYRVPTDEPESDGTLEWDSTTMIVVHARGADEIGMGFGYASQAAGNVIGSILSESVRGISALDIPAAWEAMVHGVRNQGRLGITAAAVSAVDLALWDLKGKIIGRSVAELLGSTRHSVEVYGSGGFTSYSDDRLVDQLTGWSGQGVTKVKMKIGRGRGVERVAVARSALHDSVEIYVDANGAYRRKQALAVAYELAPLGVTWFEEPVDHRDLEGLRQLRERGPAGMDMTVGEYGYDLTQLQNLLTAPAVDVLMADCTRCGGITGWLRAAAAAQAHHVPISSHTAPSAHVAAGCAAPNAMHLEYFHDHARIENMLLDGAPAIENGALTPDRSRPGLGYALKESDAKKFRL